MRRFLKTVEVLGNLLPHPVTLFAVLCVGVLVFSQIAELLNIAVTDPRPEGAKGRNADGLIHAVGLLNADGLRLIFMNTVKNFSGFAPLGTVLVAMLAVGVAEYSGLLHALIRAIVLKAPDRFVTFAVVFAGILSNTAAELGYVVLIPLGGLIFLAKGRHPIAGMAAAFAGVSGGYSANLFIGTVDPLLSGITQEAANLIAPDYTTHPAINWYFMAASSFIVAFIGTWVTEKIVEPNLGKYNDKLAEEGIDKSAAIKPLSKKEVSGLKSAAVALACLTAIALLTILPENGMLRDPNTGSIMKSPFMKGMLVWVFFFFIVPGIAYGRKVGSIKSDVDVVNAMSEAISRLGLYVVIVFFAAQFIAYFKWTNLGAIIAITGANTLLELGLTGPLIFIPFVLICGFINLMVGSASAQWALTAPVFVPMLMLVGYSPEVIQAAYRIGDSTTNIITPMMSYFGLILAFATRFDRKIGIGTIISTMLPYSISFISFWALFFYLWVFVFGLPVGPGAPTYFTQ